MNCVRSNMGWPGNGVCEDRMTKCRNEKLVLIKLLHGIHMQVYKCGIGEIVYMD
jgi:hypothetical protein